MATYFLRVKHVSRGKGSSVTRAAAYRAGERIHDERTSEVYDHSRRSDIPHKEIVLPAELTGRPDMAWALDRSTLWNAAEHAGRRRNSRLAREVLVLLPPELTPPQRVELVRAFSQELTNKYHGAVDCSIHNPRPGADPRNHHAHLLLTTREVTPEGLGARTTLELGGRERHLRGLEPTKSDYLQMRERWAQLTNDALQRAGVSARIDHRSFKDQGIYREPTATTPEKVFYAEQKGQVRSPAGDSIRARHRERLAARERGSSELDRVILKQQQAHSQRAREQLKDQEGRPQKVPWTALTRQERNQRRRERYEANREVRAKNPARQEKKRAADRERQQLNLQRDGPQIRERRRLMRQVNADEINRKQREYRKVLAERKALLARSPSAPTSEQSVKNWLAHRKTQTHYPTADDSARTWLGLRESQQLPSQTRDSAEAHSHEATSALPLSSNTDANNEDDDKKKDRSRDYDFEL